MINVIVILMECITMWLCLHIAFKSKIRRTLNEVIFFILYIGIYIVASKIGIIKSCFSIIILIMAVVWSKLLFKKKIKQTILQTLCGVIIVGALESGIILLCSFLLKFNGNVNVKSLIAVIICFISAYLIYSLRTDNNDTPYIEKNKNLLILGLGIIIFLFMVKIDFEINNRINLVNVLCFLLIVVVFTIICERQKIIYNLEKENMEYKMHQMYGRVYDELLDEIRIKQHDYKNQLMILHNLSVTNEMNENCKKIQNDYINILMEENKPDVIITKCNNPIISGCVYGLFGKCKQLDVKLCTDINVNGNKVNEKTKNVVEILGILIDNASEYLISSGIKLKEIVLSIDDINDYVNIVVGNQAKYVKNEDIEKMFSKGYSTKGKQRGIGLYSLKLIVKKYNGNITVKNELRDNQNWFVISVQI